MSNRLIALASAASALAVAAYLARSQRPATRQPTVGAVTGEPSPESGPELEAFGVEEFQDVPTQAPA
jgi:hypothetical protein